jgi:Na+/proline symporter
MTGYWHVTLPVILGYIVFVIVIGIFAARVKIKARVEEWALASRGLGVFVTFFVCGSSAISAYTFLGAPGWAYATGANVFYVVAYLTLGYFTAFFLWTSFGKWVINFTL